MTLAPTPSPTANVVLAGYTDTVVIVFALVGLMYLTYGYRLMGPTLHLAGAVAALCCALQLKPMTAAAVMLADVLIDAYLLLARILFGWLYGRGLYINELMGAPIDGTQIAIVNGTSGEWMQQCLR